MPHELTWEKDGVVKHFWGDLPGWELAESVKEVAADRRFETIRFILDDFLEVRSHTLDAGSLMRILMSRGSSRHINPNIRVLMVSTDAGLFARLDVTMSGTFPEIYETKGFATVAEARDWFYQQPPLNRPSLRGVFGH